MSAHGERVRALVRAGKLAPDEGERILAALTERPPRAWPWLLVDPFERFGGGAGVAIGAAVVLASAGASHLGVRFDGFLDLHLGKGAEPSVGLAALEQAVAWPLGAAVFWAVARAMKRGARLVDFLAAVGVARVPLALAAVPLALLGPGLAAEPRPYTVRSVALLIVVLTTVAWNLTLLYRGFKHTSGLVGPKLVAGFVAAVVIAEVASKWVLAAASR